MKGSVYIATSIDGFIARENGDIDWLDDLPPDPETGEPWSADPAAGDYGYEAFIDSVDALVMGRHSYEKVISFGIDWPYGELPVIVLSSKEVEVPEKIRGTVEAMNLEPSAVCDVLADRGMKHLYIDGGQTIQRFLAAGIIQRLTITTLPVVLGKGIPLFGPLESDLKLKLIESNGYRDGFVQTTYEVL